MQYSILKMKQSPEFISKLRKDFQPSMLLDSKSSIILLYNVTKTNYSSITVKIKIDLSIQDVECEIYKKIIKQVTKLIFINPEISDEYKKRLQNKMNVKAIKLLSLI